MPWYIRTAPPPHPRHAALVARLVREFTKPSAEGQPLILEDRPHQGRGRYLHVIWDEWEDIEPEERFDIILDAYRQLQGDDAVEQVINATGVTAQESLAFNLLPYKIEAARRVRDKHSAEDYVKAQATEKRQTLLGESASELRYARLEDAVAARKRLRRLLPGSSWVVVREEPIED